MASIKSLSGASSSGWSVGSADIADDLFGGRMNPVVLRDAVLMYEANKRQGTVNTLTRRFVNGSTVKIQRQKGAGRARHGDKKANLMRGGGIAHGPHPRSFRQSMPRKALRRALKIALAGKLRDGEIHAWSDGGVSKPSTKAVHSALASLGAEGSALIVSNGPVDSNLLLSVRNLPRVRALPASEVSAYDVVFHRNVVLLDGALDALAARVNVDADGADAGSAEDGSN